MVGGGKGAAVSRSNHYTRMFTAGVDPGFGRGGGSPASEAESCKHREAFGFLMLKYAFSHIRETLFL